MLIYRLEANVAGRFSAKATLAPLIHVAEDGSGAFITSQTYDKEPRLAKGAARTAIDEARLSEASKRIHFGWAAGVSDPAPEAVLDEMRLRLALNPGMQLEYMGRGRFVHEEHRPSAESNLVWVDVAGGRRAYLFRRLECPLGQTDARMKSNDARYLGYKAWVNEPGSRLVVSLGGGGWRLFAATAILKLLDQLVGDRARVGEVWGSSGGAVLGYAYSHGFDMKGIDEIGFDVYHGRNPALGNGSPQAALRLHARAAMDKFKGRAPTTAIGPWLDELERKQPEAQRSKTRIPFYAMATNTRSCEPTALAEAKYIPSYCKDIIFPCDARDAVGASTAVPFLLTPLRGITGFPNDTWVDGSITDENPLALPFAKWMRDRQADPVNTPERLKILSLHLNLRLSESALLKSALDLPLVKQTRFLKHAARLIDTAFDSKTYAPIQILKAMPNVELLCSKLTLGWMHFNSHREIPAAMRHGRTFEAWQNTLHRSPVISAKESS